MNKVVRALPRWGFLAFYLISLLLPSQPAYAAANLTIEPILTWDVIGLDSNNVNVGPNHFPIGARVCNAGPDPATNVTATFTLDGTNAYIGVRPGTDDTITIASLAANACYDFYFEVEVSRNSNAYDTTEGYDITVTADGGISESTPSNRELYVEHLVSQSRNAVTDVRYGTTLADLALPTSQVAAGGTMNLMVGNTYYIKMIGYTATQGYEQLETFINFPNTIFQVLSVSSTYTAGALSPNDKLYADGCTWENDTTNANYRSCLGTGKNGGNIEVLYQVKILQVPGAPLVNPEPLSTLIYDFSGSSYHYNSDYSLSTRYANIINASIDKSFSPKTMTPGSNSTLTFTINNPGATAISDANFTDILPSNVTVVTPITTPQCSGTVALTQVAGRDQIALTGGTVPGLSTCTITVTVTSSTNGTYANTTSTLKIGTTDTLDTASDTLVVSSAPAPPSSCSTRTEMARWTFENYSALAGNTITAGDSGPFDASTDILINTPTGTYISQGSSASAIIDSDLAVPTNWTSPDNTNATTVWGIRQSWLSAAPADITNPTSPFFQFQVNTDGLFGGIGISLDYDLVSASGWTNSGTWYVLYSTNGTTWSNLNSGAWTKNAWQLSGITATSTSTTTNVYFRIYFVGASSSQNANANAYFDNVVLTGCATPPPPTILKSFQTDPISVGSVSTLTFTINNTTSGSSNLSGLSFTDVLPGGLVINTPNGLSSTCGAVTATAGTSTISLSGSLIANNSCTISVSVKGAAAGFYTNTTTNITANESGANTSTTPNVGFGQDTLTVISPPVIAKSFTANPIFTGNTTLLNFSINNPNTSTALTNIAFTDNLPSGLVVDTTTTAPATPATSDCGGTLTANDSTSLVQLSGVNSLAAGDTCTITVRVRGTTAGLKSNFATVSSSNGGTGNTTTASVLVKDPEPRMGFAKYVGLSNAGPWVKSQDVTLPDTVYYLLFIENTGDVPLTNITVTDLTVDPSGCTWVDGDGTTISTSNSPFTLPVVSSNPAIDAHYATCTLGDAGGITALDGVNTNTASADPAELSPATSSATYTGSAPNLGLAKTDGVTSVAGNATPTFTLTVSNTGNVATNGTITVVDVLPSGMTISDSVGFTPGGTDGGNWNCVAASNVITCTSSTVIAGNSTSVFSFQVTVDANPPNVMTNKAQVGGGNDPTNSSAPTGITAGQCTGTDAPNEGCAVDTDTANSPNLGLLKDDGVTSVTAGGTTSYSLTVTNNGSADTSGTVTVVDVPPAGLAVTAISGTGWICTLATLTCTRSDVLSPPNSYPAITVSANVDATAIGILTNKAQVGGGGDPSNPSAPTSATAGQCTGTNVLNKGCAVDSDTVNYVNLGLAKSNSATVIPAGGTTTYTLTVTNSGNTSTGVNTITVVDALPTGLSISNNAGFTPGGTNGADWSCAAASNIITCTSTTVIAGSGGTGAFDLTVNVASNASGALTNPAQVGGGGDPTNPNPPTSTTAGQCTGTNTPNKGCAVDTDTVNSPSLGLTKSNSSNTILAGSTTTYDMVVTNAGNVATSGTITLVDVLPTGLSVADGALAIGGTNSADWSCSAASNVITCTSSAVIATNGGTSVFNFTVNVAANASGTLTNPAQVGGGGDPSNPSAPTSTTAGQCTGTNTPNKGCAVDSDSVNVPNLGLAKNNGGTTLTPGATTTYTLTMTNNGNTATSGTITVVDVLPTGLSISDNAGFTPGGTNGADWTCVAASDVITCTSSIAIAGSGGASVFSLTVNVDANAAGTITNPAQVGGGGDPTNPNAPTNVTAGRCSGANTPNEGCATDSDTVNAAALFDPPAAFKTFNAAGLPVLEFRMIWINNGNVVAINVQVMDTIPAGTTYVTNSITCSPQGASVNAAAASAPLSAGAVPNSFCGYDAGANSIQWQGTIAPDPGVLNDANAETNAANEVVITFQVTVNVNVNQVSNVGTSRTDANNNGAFNDQADVLGTTISNSNLVVWDRGGTSNAVDDPGELPDTLPKTGFAPNRVTILPEQPEEQAYRATDVWLEVPRLGLMIPIVGVPISDGDWDITWLWKEAGWLEGTAFPSWQGNSVLTGHVTLPNGEDGPFTSIGKLKWGDQVIIYAYGVAFEYEVRQVRTVGPLNTSILKHEEEPWLTLLTCKDYVESTGEYTSRIAVRAVLIGTEEDKTTSGKNVR